MAKQQESSLSTSLQALAPFREQQQSGAGFGGGGGKMFHHLQLYLAISLSLIND